MIKKLFKWLIFIFVLTISLGINGQSKAFAQKTTYTVSFLSNGGTGKMSKQTIKYNKKVTLNELYKYSYENVLEENPNQHIAVYPKNSTFIIFGKYK